MWGWESTYRGLTPKKNKRLLGRIYTKKELGYCFSKESPAAHLAARFAGKEAIIKALNSIGKTKATHKDVEILNDKKGVPSVRLNKSNLNSLTTRLSLSHCEDTAIAFAIIFKNNKKELGKNG
jgi:holo-[acyl-carrier protein] synthase